MSDIVKKRLFLTKKMYEHGYSHSKRNSVLDKLIAIHNLDNAVEIMLKAIYLEYEIRTPSDIQNLKFANLVSDIDNHFKDKDDDMKLPYSADIKRLHNYRNTAQHDAVEPSDGVLDEFRVITRKFLVNVSDEYFRENWEDLSDIEFIINEEIRSQLTKAKDLLLEEKYKESIESSHEAFNTFYMKLITYFIHDVVHFQGISTGGTTWSAVMLEICKKLVLHEHPEALVETSKCGVTIEREEAQIRWTVNRDLDVEPNQENAKETLQRITKIIFDIQDDFYYILE